MAFTINGIACEEITAGYTESAELGTGVESRKGFLCDWADRFALAQGLLGFTTAAAKNSAITFYYPARHPELKNCYARRIEFEGVGVPTRGPYQLQFTKCIVWADFGPIRFTPVGQTSLGDGEGIKGFVYAEQKMSSSCQWVTIPGKHAIYSGTIRGVPGDYGFRIALIELEITLHALPYMPDFVVQQQSGTINNAKYLGFATGKLMFNGVTTSESANTDGTYTAEGTYSFTGRTERWDYAFDGVTGTWKQVVKPVLGTAYVPSTDFSTIIPTGYSF